MSLSLVNGAFGAIGANGDNKWRQWMLHCRQWRFGEFLLSFEVTLISVAIVSHTAMKDFIESRLWIGFVLVLCGYVCSFLYK